MTPAEALRLSAATYEEREATYGANYLRVGKAMEAFFSNGVQLSSASDFTRYHIITLIVGKIGRYINNWDKGGHPDSLIDVMAYAAILAALGGDADADSQDRDKPG